MKLNFRIEQEYDNREPLKPLELATLFRNITKKLDVLLGTKKTWYEQGYSRKQALQHKVFEGDRVSENVLARWQKEYEKDYPNWTEGIWDGEPDNDSSGIDCYTSYSSTGRREKPLKLVVTFIIEQNKSPFDIDNMVDFFISLLRPSYNCTYACVESGGYSFPKMVPKENGYDEIYKKVFPDRASCGWMLYIPHVLLPDLIP
ncbi:hypothetical protein, partial [Serratia marcescens]|uniref:hypothetical protein n=1 Tax=Serratia marcescens TaxID=615 RepID=UPI0011E86D20